MRPLMKSLLWIATLLADGSCQAENFILEVIWRAATKVVVPLSRGGTSGKHQEHDPWGPAAAPRLEVISAGLARTGTASLQAALQVLGYKPYHNGEVLTNDHSSLWGNVFNASLDPMMPATSKSAALQNVATAMTDAGYDATTDSPTADYALELLSLYPEAKVILMTRSTPEDWYASVVHLVPLIDAMSIPPFSLMPRFRNFGVHNRVLLSKVWGCLYVDTGEDQSTSCIAYYHAHNARVRDNIPANQLLEFHPSMGWGPLCEFMGKPVPKETSFPHINDSTSMDLAIFALGGISMMFNLSFFIASYYLIHRAPSSQSTRFLFLRLICCKL
mmetsp:Transcript_57585/g.171731  ORF Transcript_57585/g.171731 Transcript_57585/m.171731 type:complete len:331 (-) Transcript_57585:768-1760(-)